LSKYIYALVAVLLVLSVSASFGSVLPGFTAYNDCAGTSSGNTTAYGCSPSQSLTSGILKDYATGNNTSVTVTAATNGDGGSYPQPATGVPSLTGTDAGNVFTGKVDLLGVEQYGASTGWYFTLTFSGLNPNAKYEFVTTAVRDGFGQGSDYSGRITKYSISGADSYTNSSTSGTTIAGDGSWTTFCTGENRVGYVARWTQVVSGSDGIVVFRAESGSSTRQAYGFSGFMLKEVPEPGSLVALSGGLMGLVGFAFRKRRS
jgi:hypothetical protein